MAKILQISLFSLLLGGKTVTVSAFSGVYTPAESLKVK